MSCQKVVNVLAVASSVVSLAVVGVGGYVYINKDTIINNVTESVLGGLGGGLPTGANDLPSLGSTPTMAPSAPTAQAETPF